MWQTVLLALLGISDPTPKAPVTKPVPVTAKRPEVKVAMAPVPTQASEVVAKVQDYYVKTTKLQADFRQEYVNTTFGKTSISEGKVYILKPGKMRWDYAKPDKKYFISDGTVLWIYEEAAKQAAKKSLADQLLPVAVTFLYGQGDLAKDFNASLEQPGKHGVAGDFVLHLVPKEPSAQYTDLWLVVDPADFHVKQSIILEVSGNENRFTFTGIKLNDAAKQITDKLFGFKPPKGVKVVDADAEAAAAGAPAGNGK